MVIPDDLCNWAPQLCGVSRVTGISCIPDISRQSKSRGHATSEMSKELPIIIILSKDNN
jgi:hypothetical protein